MNDLPMPPVTKPALNSEMLLSKIEVFPQKKVKDLYADELLKYRSFIEVDSSANYISSDSLLKVIRERDGRYFVHYAVEPNRLSIGSSGGKFFVRLEVFGKISDSENKAVYQFQKDVSLNFTPEQVTEMKAKRFSFQDAFALIDGRYKFDLLIKNPVSKEFTSFESEVVIPRSDSRSAVSPLLLSAGARRETGPSSNLRPFRMGDIQVYPVANRAFTKSDQLFISFTVDRLPQSLRETGSLEFSFFLDDKKVHFSKKALKDFGNSGDCFEGFSLAGLDPGLYTVVVSLLDQDHKEVSSSKEDFSISTQRALPAVWSVSEVIPPLDDPYYSYVLGMQDLNCGRLSEAKALLEEAYHGRPASLDFALGLGQVYLRSAAYQRVQDILTRFLERANEQPQVYELLGRCSFLQSEHGRAIYYFKKYLAHFGTKLEILNMLAECFFQTGDLEEAKAAWKKSLEMEPRQEQIRKKLDAVERRSSTPV